MRDIQMLRVMEKIDRLAQQYDAQRHVHLNSAPPPTPESVAKIEEHFGCALPKSHIRFCEKSAHYGDWLASIGPDFESPNHIININRLWREEVEENERIPPNLLIINVGYDEDLDCIDMETFDEATGEYPITYWAYGVPPEESDLSGSFFDYMAKQVRGW
ncbi:SMI1/KNR4 family protein [Hahella sp. NBU794]|uniref:SMI1/KNR4 family protein n=1 Tax=Hahella sp. NBU794 TaxID=3422590 RepID=UPI003D6DC568